MAIDEKDYWNTVEMIKSFPDSYVDWEGFTDRDRVTTPVEMAYEHNKFLFEDYTEEQRKFVLDMTMHVVHHQYELGVDNVDEWQAVEIMITVDFLFRSQLYMKSDV